MVANLGDMVRGRIGELLAGVEDDRVRVRVGVLLDRCVTDLHELVGLMRMVGGGPSVLDRWCRSCVRVGVLTAVDDTVLCVWCRDMGAACGVSMPPVRVVELRAQGRPVRIEDLDGQQ